MVGVLEKLFRTAPERGNSSHSLHVDQENEDPSVQRQGPVSDRKHLILGRMVLAEMVGTFILVFSVCGVVSCSYVSRGELGLTEYALTGCVSLVVLAVVVGPISGAHVNPSITIAFATIGEFPWSKVPYYVAAQMVGSTMAAYVGKLVYKTPPEFAATRPTRGSMTAFWAELFATMFIMLISSALSFHAEVFGQVASFAIGASIGLAVLITGPVSGGSMNPARSLGPAIVSWRFDDLWLYLVAPTAGAVTGALLYKLMQFPHPHPTHGHCNSSSSSSSSPSPLGASQPTGAS
ncbi:unnamed protein product [Spirodela intermedia]|uniref:Uncharacterized protein n=1 Tax=Spirodela intermedia TaxID=51605 RepID=A0A7I8JXS6_SPIIN|nr:unnamed protein product [Spirodela intermedia]